MTTKPDYATLLAQIATETDPTAKQALIEQCYVFLPDDPDTPEDESITEAEEQLFEYVERDYVVSNPGYDESNTFISYAGVYFDVDGNKTGVL